MKQETINHIFEIWQQENPHPKTELEFSDNFTLLIAVVLSAQSTDKAVNKATRELFKVAKTPKEIITLGEDGLKKFISKIGLFNSKASNIIKLCNQILEDFHGEIPNDLENLKSLAGVGQKTANVVLNCAFNKPTIAVDTHVFRVANRIGLASATNPEKCEIQLKKNIPKKWQFYAHHWMILHGRYICMARKPKCSQCKIKKFCKFYLSSTAEF